MGPVTKHVDDVVPNVFTVTVWLPHDEPLTCTDMEHAVRSGIDRREKPEVTAEREDGGMPSCSRCGADWQDKAHTAGEIVAGRGHAHASR